MKQFTMALSFPHHNPHDVLGTNKLYRVERVTDSTTPSVGDYLEKKQVDDYCQAKNWRVTIQPVK